MADKPTAPEAAQDAPEDARTAPRRKASVPPTIDLTAQELASADQAAERPPASPQSADEQSGPGRESVADGSGGKNRPRSRAGLIGVTLAAGFIGAVLAAAGMSALWFYGLLPARDAGPAVMQGRIAALQTQLNELQKQPPATDGKAIAALSDRLSKIEHTVAQLPLRDPDMAERLATADNAIKALGVALTALNKRGDDVAANAAKAQQSAEAATKAVADLRASLQASEKNSSGGGASVAELEALQERLAALELKAKEASTNIVRNSNVDSAARLALSAVALRDAVESGAPFAAELKQAQSFGADSKDLAPLTPFAATGVPGDKTLAHELSTLIPAMLKASGTQAPPGDFLDKLQASAGRLVRIRPLDAPAGDDASAVLARLEIDAAHADIAGALSDLGKAPDRVRKVAAAWIEQAKGRNAALQAARKLATDATRGLGQP